MNDKIWRRSRHFISEWLHCNALIEQVCKGRRRTGAISWHVSTAGAHIIVNLTAGVVTAGGNFFQIPRWARLVCLRHRLIPGGGNLEPEEPSVKPNICNCWLLNRQLLVPCFEKTMRGDEDRGLMSYSWGWSEISLKKTSFNFRYGPILSLKWETCWMIELILSKVNWHCPPPDGIRYVTETNDIRNSRWKPSVAFQ